MIKELRADYFITVYGNHYFLKEAAKIAYGLGYQKDKVFVPDNGSVIKFTLLNAASRQLAKGELFNRVDQIKAEILPEKVPSNYIFVDGLGVGDVGEIVLRDRQMLAEDGMFVIVAIVDSKTGKVKNSPDIISRGFVYLRESKDLLRQTRKKVIEIVDKTAGHGLPVNWSYVKDEIRNKIGNFLHSKTSRRPMILPVVIEV